MTLEEMAKRIETLEAEVRNLKARLATKGGSTGSWLDTFGSFADDPTYLEAARLGREWRDQVNRESLEEFDRQERKEKKRKPTTAGKAKTSKPVRTKKPTARSRETNGRA